MLSLDYVYEDIDNAIYSNQFFTCVDSLEPSPTEIISQTETKKLILSLIESYLKSPSANSKHKYTKNILVEYFVNAAPSTEVYGKYKKFTRVDNVLKNFGSYLKKHIKLKHIKLPRQIEEKHRKELVAVVGKYKAQYRYFYRKRIEKEKHEKAGR